MMVISSSGIPLLLYCPCVNLVACFECVQFEFTKFTPGTGETLLILSCRLEVKSKISMLQREELKIRKGICIL